ncbi:MAG: ArsC/Spx/MgsR family protein, partial [Janthinobacterium lividum]
HSVEFTFHDLKKSGIDRALVDSWLHDLEWEFLVNRKGTTWRALEPARRAAIVDAHTAAQLMLDHPSVVKRPVLCTGQASFVGFSPQLYQQLFNRTTEKPAS